MKLCKKCNSEKTLDSFAWKNKNLGKLQDRCRECQSLASANHYAKNKSVYLERDINRRVKYREIQYEFLKNRECIDCGESDPIVLEFDHIDETTKDFAVSSAIVLGKSVDDLLNEMSKCEIRCANCHRRKTATQFGWYKHKSKNKLMRSKNFFTNQGVQNLDKSKFWTIIVIP